MSGEAVDGGGTTSLGYKASLALQWSSGSTFHFHHTAPPLLLMYLIYM